jgi:hypothetical protein
MTRKHLLRFKDAQMLDQVLNSAPVRMKLSAGMQKRARRIAGCNNNSASKETAKPDAFNTRPDKNGNITITFSVEDPRDGTYWMPANAGEPCYFVGRYYEPDLNNIPGRPCD